MTKQKLLTTKELAERWTCSEATIRTLVTRGTLAHMRLGRRLIRYRLEDVEHLESDSFKAGEE
jgi:excisionase family DNA binding protein